MKKRFFSALAAGVILSCSLGSPALADVRVVTGYPTAPAMEKSEKLVDVNVLLPIGNVYDDSGVTGAVGHRIEMRKLIATPAQVNGMNEQELKDVPVFTTRTGTTDNNGIASFTGLEQGLWIMEPLFNLGDAHSFQTMVVDLPTLDPEGNWDHTVDLIAKPVPTPTSTPGTTTVTSPHDQEHTDSGKSPLTTTTASPVTSGSGSGDGNNGNNNGNGSGNTGNNGGSGTQQSPSSAEQQPAPALTRLAETGASVIGLSVIMIGLITVGIALMRRRAKDK